MGLMISRRGEMNLNRSGSTMGNMGKKRMKKKDKGRMR